jgi:hypothetical protein
MAGGQALRAFDGPSLLILKLRVLHLLRLEQKVGRFFDVAFSPNTTPPERPVYAITQKLVSRPVEFFLLLCHATNGDFSNDARDKSCGQPVLLTGEEKANRNTPEFRNRPKPLKTQEFTFSNRNKKHVSVSLPVRASRIAGHGLAQSDVGEGPRDTGHESQFTSHESLHF